MSVVRFNRDGHAVAVGDALQSVEREFRSDPSIVRVERMEINEACRLHLEYLATLPRFQALLSPSPRPQPIRDEQER